MRSQIFGALEAIIGLIIAAYALSHNSSLGDAYHQSQAAGALAGILMLVFGIGMMLSAHRDTRSQVQDRR